MSIDPIVMQLSSRKWKARLLLLACLLTGSLLAMGAKDVTDELRLRPAFQTQMRHCLTAWNQAIVMEFPASQRPRWQRVLERHPELLLDACALQELPASAAVPGGTRHP